jgi:hypothetical protein
VTNQPDQTASLAGGPIGPRAVSFLRRVRSIGGAYRLAGDADRQALPCALRAGFIVRDRKNAEVVHLTNAGAAYLDRLMRAD